MSDYAHLTLHQARSAELQRAAAEGRRAQQVAGAGWLDRLRRRPAAPAEVLATPARILPPRPPKRLPDLDVAVVAVAVADDAVPVVVEAVLAVAEGVPAVADAVPAQREPVDVPVPESLA